MNISPLGRESRLVVFNTQEAASLNSSHLKKAGGGSERSLQEVLSKDILCSMFGDEGDEGVFYTIKEGYTTNQCQVENYTKIALNRDISSTILSGSRITTSFLFERNKIIAFLFEIRRKSKNPDNEGIISNDVRRSFIFHSTDLNDENLKSQFEDLTGLDLRKKSKVRTEKVQESALKTTSNLVELSQRVIKEVISIKPEFIDSGELPAFNPLFPPNFTDELKAGKPVKALRDAVDKDNKPLIKKDTTITIYRGLNDSWIKKDSHGKTEIGIIIFIEPDSTIPIFRDPKKLEDSRCILVYEGELSTAEEWLASCNKLKDYFDTGSFQCCNWDKLTESTLLEADKPRPKEPSISGRSVGELLETIDSQQETIRTLRKERVARSQPNLFSNRDFQEFVYSAANIQYAIKLVEIIAKKIREQLKLLSETQDQEDLSKLSLKELMYFHSTINDKKLTELCEGFKYLFIYLNMEYGDTSLIAQNLYKLNLGNNRQLAENRLSWDAMNAFIDLEKRFLQPLSVHFGMTLDSNKPEKLKFKDLTCLLNGDERHRACELENDYIFIEKEVVNIDVISRDDTSPLPASYLVDNELNLRLLEDTTEDLKLSDFEPRNPKEFTHIIQAKIQGIKSS